MIELDRHIEILLLDNDCVIVPGLGGFMTHHIEAAYDAEDRLFLPPARTLGFNPQLKMNDSLLAQSYVEAYDMSYPEAVKRIEDEVNQLEEHIENHGSYTLNGIGTLSSSENGSYNFEPCEAGILTPPLYALSSFEMAPLAAQSTNTENEKLSHASIIPFAATPVTKDAEQETEEEAKTAKTISIRVSALRNFVAAAIAIVAILLYPSPVSNPNIQQGAINTDILDKIMPVEVAAPQTSLPVAEKESKAITPEAPIAETTDKLHEDSNFYCIVLASKITKTNACAYAQKLRDKGFDKTEALVRKNGSKVIYGHYKTENDAYNALNALSDNEAFSDGWVTHIK